MEGMPLLEHTFISHLEFVPKCSVVRSILFNTKVTRTKLPLYILCMYVDIKEKENVDVKHLSNSELEIKRLKSFAV